MHQFDVYLPYMGTILVYRNIKFVIYSKDHPPAHIHAISPNGEAKIELGSLECFFCRGYSQRDLKMIINLVKEKQDILLEAWDEIHS